MGWSDVMHFFLSPMSLKGTKQQISFPFTPTGKIPIVLVSLLACWHVCSNSHFPLTDLGGYQWAGTRLSHRKMFRPSGWKPFDVLLVYCILIKANHYKWECNGFCTMHDRWWNILPISGLVTTTTYRFIHTQTHSFPVQSKIHPWNVSAASTAKMKGNKNNAHKCFMIPPILLIICKNDSYMWTIKSTQPFTHFANLFITMTLVTTVHLLAFMFHYFVTTK